MNSPTLPRLNLPAEPEPTITYLKRYYNKRYQTLVERLQMCDDYHIQHGQGPMLQEHRTVDQLIGHPVYGHEKARHAHHTIRRTTR